MKSKPVPTLHIIQMGIAGGVLALSMILFIFVPADRINYLTTIGTLAAGFLFGKFTNNFVPGSEQLKRLAAAVQAELEDTRKDNAELRHRLHNEEGKENGED